MWSYSWWVYCRFQVKLVILLPWIKHASKLGLAEKFLHFHQQWCLRRNSIPMGVWRILMDKRLMAWRRWGCRPCTESLTICTVQIHYVVSMVTKLSIGYCVLIYTQVGISRGLVYGISHWCPYNLPTGTNQFPTLGAYEPWIDQLFSKIPKDIRHAGCEYIPGLFMTVICTIFNIVHSWEGVQLSSAHHRALIVLFVNGS